MKNEKRAGCLPMIREELNELFYIDIMEYYAPTKYLLTWKDSRHVLREKRQCDNVIPYL